MNVSLGVLYRILKENYVFDLPFLIKQNILMLHIIKGIIQIVLLSKWASMNTVWGIMGGDGPFQQFLYKRGKGVYMDALPIIYWIQTSEFSPVHFRADWFYLQGFNAISEH